MNLLINWLIDNAIDYLTDVNLSDYSYLKTGGAVSVIISPKTTIETAKCVSFLNAQSISYKVVGATSNLLFLDDVEYSCFLSTTSLKGIECISDTEIITGSGEMLPDLSRYALRRSLKGFEGLEGIPGTIGGAVFMNAGAYGYEIKDVLDFIEIVEVDGAIKVYKTSELAFRNRNSALRTGEIKGIVTKCGFKGRPSIASLIESKMEVYHSKRHKYSEQALPNLGSIFSGSIYRDLGRNDKYFYALSSLFYLLNYKFKIFRRESPMNRKWINDIAVRRFKFNYKIQPFSNKTLNCLVNRGQGTDEMVRYINEINSLTELRVPLENEIVHKF